MQLRDIRDIKISKILLFPFFLLGVVLCLIADAMYAGEQSVDEWRARRHNKQ